MSALNGHPLLRAELAICGGALPGFLAAQADPNRGRKRRSTKLDHMLAAVAARPLPPAPGYTHYLPCALLGNGRLAASQPVHAPAITNGAWSGFLFVGPAGMEFQSVPSSENTARAPLAIDSPPERIEMGPVRELVATAVALDHRVLSRSSSGEPAYALQVRWPGGMALFGVPTIGDTVPALYRCLDTFRWDRKGPPAQAGQPGQTLPAGPSAVL